MSLFSTPTMSFYPNRGNPSLAIRWLRRLHREGALSSSRSNNYTTSTSFQILSSRTRPSRRRNAPPPPLPLIRHSCQRSIHLTLTRFHANAVTTSSNQELPITTNDKDDELLDPYVILRKIQNLSNNEDIIPTIPFPAYFSPTSLEQFHKCPQAFFFLYILKLTPDPPMTPELARGILCHTALEEMFDLSPADRNLINLENLFRRAWKKVRGDREDMNGHSIVAPDDDQRNYNSKEMTQYDSLFRKHDIGNDDDDDERSGAIYDIESETNWGESSLRLLKNYMELEDPSQQSPLMREMWVHARFPLDGDSNEHPADDFIIKGKIDRIDILPGSSTSEERLQLQIIDYKTGKKPWFKYSQSVNDRIFQDQFWKMKVYALILWKMILQTEDVASAVDNGAGQQKDQYKYRLSWELQQRLANAMDNVRIGDTGWSNMLELKSLRLIHLTSHLDDASVNNSVNAMNDKGIIGKATYLDYALDAPSEFERVILDQTEREVQAIVRGVKKLVDAQSPHAFKHCDWRYCSCHEFRRRFRPGSVHL